MDTEHSILLKYFVKGHRLNSKTEMADTPIIKIEKEYQNPPNVESEVPGTHEIREASKNNTENNSPEEYNKITVTSAGFTLSPVITVTKNESTFTKGNMKQHKVTVTEDISVTVENGNHKIADSIDDLSSGDQADSIDFRSDTTTDNMEGEEKSHEEKKSKIPMSRLKQVAERVKRERQAQREKAKPRRSSIPKLKDPKKVKRDTSLNIEPQVDDEFEKLYEEIVDDKPIEIEVKLPVVSIDDPEKIETKFEELIHAYDEEETVVEEIVVDQLIGEETVVDESVGDEKVIDASVGEEKIVEQAVEETRPSISKVSKIPALSKKEDSPSMRALMERVKEVSAAEAELKDGGFKVTASNIRTKRYSRGNSELSRDEQRIDSIEEIEDDSAFDVDNAQSSDKDGDVSKGEKKATKPRSIRKKSELLEQQRQTKLREELRRKQKQLRNGIEEPVVVEKVGDNIDDLNAVLMKTERIVRNISREINDDKKSIINTETVTTEEQNDGGVRTITTTTTETFVVDSPVVYEKIIRNISRENTGTIEVITEEKPKKAASSIPVKTERFTRGISREMGNFRQSIHREVNQSKEDLNATDNKVDNKPVLKKETMRVEQIEKEGIKIGIPVFTKISRSYSKGKIQNVEMSRTIEWKPADVVTNKALNRSTSEAITKNELKDAKRDFKAPVSETNNNNINGDTTRDTVKENNIKDTVKAQAKTKSIRKVTEFKTEEQVTNEERTTFTLSRSVDLSLDNDFKTARAIGTQMSVDGQNIDRDYKIGKDASTRISVINEKLVPKDLKPSREIGTQMSVDMSKTQEENNKVVPVIEKKETADSNLPVKEKESDITQVTTLKGNVSRLKEKMGKDKEIGSKKEKEEEFPKKKSVLSKIAMFERLERDPIEQLPLRKLKCKYKPPTKTTHQTEDTEEIANTVAEKSKEETQTEPNTIENKVEISVTYDTVAYTNEPIIVKEYLKSEYNENLLKDNAIGKDETLANTVDTTNVDDSEYTEPVSPLLEIVDLNPKESVIEIPKTPEPRKDTEMPTIFPPRRDYEADIGRTRPGKLNLNNWTNQVEINKSTVDKVAVFKEEQIQEIVHTLPSIDIKAYASQVSVNQELPRTFDDKTNEDDGKSAKVLYGKVEIQLETVQTIPEVIDVTPVSNIVISDDFQNVDDGNLPLDEKETKSYDLAPDTTPGCPVLTELDFETLKLMNKSPETREILVETRPKPGKLDLSLWKNRVEENRNHIGKDIKNNPEMKKEVSTKVFKPRRISDTLPLKNELNDAGNKDETPVVKDNETNDSTYKYAITDSDVTSDEIYTSSSESDDEQSYKGKDRHRMPTGVSMYKKDVESKPKPGKLDLSMWKNQVEANRNVADFKKKPKKIEITTEVSGKKVFKSYTKGSSDKVQGKDDLNKAGNKDESLETGADYKSEIQVEIETVLPDTVEAKSVEIKPETAKPLIALINVNKHKTTYVPNNNTNTEEQPKLLQGKIDLETGYTYECKAEIGVHDPDTVCFTSADYVEENVTTLPAIITFETDDIKIENPKPGKLDLKAWEDQVEANKVLVDKIEAVRNEHLEDVAKTLTGKVDFVTFEHVGEARMFQATIDLNTNDDKVEIAEAEDDLDADIDVEYESIKPDSNTAPLNYIFPRRASRDDQLYNEGNRAQILNQLVSESLSDPDLVKDEPVQKPNSDKDSVIGSVKRKLYFLSSINRVHNPVIREESREKDDVGNDDDTKADAFETKAYLINDLGPKSNAASIEDIEAHTRTVTEDNKPTTPPNTAQIETADVKGRSNENVFHFDVTRVENRMTRSVYGVGEFKNSTEDMQRAKSLAELDLGDAVQGKVRSILSRINSVDFGRRESIKTSINVKEMPRKMSVLEKIALFEGKLTSPKPEPPTEDTPTDNQEPVAVPGLSEEAYLKKIQELQSAKVQFGKMDKMNSVVLSDGTKMPVLTVGTALLDARLLKHIIGAAIDMGYRAIDTAYIYGNEKEVGEAIQAKIDDGTVTREQLYIMGKLWSTFHKTDLVETACKNSLEALGITYFDLYMIHNPMSFKEGPDPIPKIASVIQFSEYDYLDAWYGMESLVHKGLAKSIGVSNFNSVQLQRILDKGKIAPVVNQVECHPYLSQQRLDAFCKEKDIQLSCYGVLGSKGTPAEYKNSTFAVIDDPLVKVMASGLGVSPAQLLIRYQIDSGHNVVVKASCAPHLWDNLQALTFELDKPQVEALHALNKNKRTFTFKGMGETHKNYPFLEPF